MRCLRRRDKKRDRVLGCGWDDTRVALFAMGSLSDLAEEILDRLTGSGLRMSLISSHLILQQTLPMTFCSISNF